jgi:prepilin-type processing-associated H-X9-DG protein
MNQIPVPEAADAPIESAMVAERGAALLLLMGAGGPRTLDAARLRAACRCAHCVRARHDGLFPQAFDDIAIVEVAPIGHYGINIAFSDGHARGIYPWSYLLDLLKE